MPNFLEEQDEISFYEHLGSMRIGIDGRGLQYRPWGGVRHYTLTLLQALFALDCENEYHVFYNAWKKIEVPRFTEFSNVTVHYSRWPNKLFNLIVKLFERPKFRLAQGTLDILFVPNLNFVAYPTSAKLVTVAHDLSFEHFPEYFSRRLRLWHQAVNPRRLFERADQVIAVSKHTKGDLIETYGLPESKISVVYPGVTGRHPERLPAQAGREGPALPVGRSLTNVSSHAREIPRFTRNDVGGKYILYFGALEPRKNIQGLITAYEALKPREALVIAGLATPYVERLKQSIAVSKLRDCITLRENPSEGEKWTLYAGARLFVYPSFYEGFGFPPLEAMAAGVPVVASSASSVPEMCGEAAILVNPWQVQEIKEGMRILLADSELRKKYIAAGINRVQEFSWQTAAEGVLKVFRKALTS